MPIASPPPNYTLDRPGTSGVACGPHLSIRSPGGLTQELKRGEVGAICVRGLPAFEGYEVPPASGASASEQAGKIDTSAISPEGWFDSGDMGWMDEDGYASLPVYYPVASH
jgi:acyl-CoA synthetase (AMP-forming)/AMP-acid ligase II